MLPSARSCAVRDDNNKDMCVHQKNVQVGQSFRKVGYGCTSCWGDVGAGDAEADVIYISFIVSAQHIGY